MSPWSIFSIGVVCAATMVVAASNADTWLSLGAALTFSAIVTLVGVWRNGVSIRKGGAVDANALVEASRMNATIFAVTFLWGGLVMLGVYSLSGLWWWHSWQYGALMFAIGGALCFYAREIGDAGHPLRDRRFLDASAVLALAQGIGAAGGLYFLISSGKLGLVKPDWPANHVFLALGIAIFIVSLTSVVAHVVLRSRS